VKNILILTFKPIHNGPRHQRQLDALADEFNIYTAGQTPSGREKAFFRYDKINLLNKLARIPYLALRRHEAYYWDRGKIDLLNKLRQHEFDLIIAHDEDTLPLAR